MITDIQTVRFFRTEKDANKAKYENGLLICTDGDFIQIVDDKNKMLKHEDIWSYTETNDIGLHNLKIGK